MLVGISYDAKIIGKDAGIQLKTHIMGQGLVAASGQGW
jgi:hypothetical protein